MATITVFLPGKSHGQRSLAGYTPKGCKGLDVTERASTKGIQQLSELRVDFYIISKQVY